MKSRLQITVAMLALFAILQTPAAAQTQHKVTIENGIVFVNGKQIAEKDLPESLADLSKTTTLQFWGDANAIMELNGIAYMVSDGKLLEAPKDLVQSGNLHVLFSTDENIPVRLIERAPEAKNWVVRSNDASRTYTGYVKALNERADEVENIRLKIESGAVPEQAILARQLSVEAENAARLVRSFPMVQFETYLNEIQDNDRILYNELIREHEMEAQTHHLAMKIREAESRTDQEEATEELREALESIFELKQENRRVEIEQLSLRLSELKERLKERESLKDDIVENRIRELLEQYRWNP